MPAPNHNGDGANGAGEPTDRPQSTVDLITEAEELRNVLADASTRLSHLLWALKQQRKQSRAMKAAMQSLKQLQLDG